MQFHNPQKAMDFLSSHSYGEIQQLVEDLTQEEAGTFWSLIEDQWRTVCFYSGKGGRGRAKWTSLLRKMTLFERKAQSLATTVIKDE